MLFVNVPPTHGIWLQMSLMTVITLCFYFLFCCKWFKAEVGDVL